MAKLIGIDYGSKRVGIAISDESGSVAFPTATLSTNQQLVSRVAELIQKEGVTTIVMGESKNASGTDNTVMAAAREFASKLSEAAGIAVQFEPEYYTSVQARRDTGQSFVDAEAAAILLNSYIERTKK